MAPVAFDDFPRGAEGGDLRIPAHERCLIPNSGGQTLVVIVHACDEFVACRLKRDVERGREPASGEFDDAHTRIDPHCVENRGAVSGADAIEQDQDVKVAVVLAGD